MNEIAIREMNSFLSVNAADPVVTYSSFRPKTEDDEVKLFNAVADPKYRLRECVNQVIEMIHFYVEPVSMTDKSGEEKVAPRVIIIDKYFNSFQCVSMGIYNSLRRIVSSTVHPERGVCSPEDWTNPIPIIPKLITKGEYNIITLTRAKPGTKQNFGAPNQEEF